MSAGRSRVPASRRMTRQSTLGFALVTALAVVLPAPASNAATAMGLESPALSTPGGEPGLAALDGRLDDWLLGRVDDPAAARAWLEAAAPVAGKASVEWRRRWLFARGFLDARDAPGKVPAAAQALRALADQGHDPAAGAAANLLEADVDETNDRVAQAGERARRAAAALAAACPLGEPMVEAPKRDVDWRLPRERVRLPAACDHRLAWRALELLGRLDVARGATTLALGHAARARELAWRADDDRRYALSTGMLGLRAALSGQPATAATLQREALSAANALGDAHLQARILNMLAAAAAQSGHPGEARELIQRALPAARRTNDPRLLAALLNNLADAETRAGRHREALRAVEQALPSARQWPDLRQLERTLLHNATLARIGLGRIAEVRADISRLVELERAAGRGMDAAVSLREFSQALAAAGAHREALELYHRERDLTAELEELNRRSAIEGLQQAYDTARKQRDIALLARDNAVKAEALTNEALQQRSAVLLTLVVGLVGALALLVAIRLREAQRHLVASQAQLRVASERDPLTQLANRRHFLAVMDMTSSSLRFEGALLLVDIDHFKRVNDRLGHAAGDTVLVEVSRRLLEAVRADDLVVRWGGEEFLVVARDVAGVQLDALVRRVLNSVAGAPIPGRGHDADAPVISPLPVAAPLHVSASIGYARFPLPPRDEAVGWEPALRLVDRALALAKRRGRNRAIGLMALHAGDAGQLTDDAAFDLAVAEGRLALHIEHGPTTPTVVPPEPAAQDQADSSCLSRQRSSSPTSSGLVR